MIDETVQLIAAAAEDEANGVNAIAQVLPRFRFGGIIENPAPPVVPIVNDSDDASVSSEEGPSELPAFMLWADAGGAPKARATAASDVTLFGAFVTRADADSMTAARTANLIVRAAMICFARFNSQALSGAYRELNGVRVLMIDEDQTLVHRVTWTVGRIKYWNLIEIHAQVVDTFVAPRAARRAQALA